MLITWIPYRFSFYGGGLYYPTWFKKYETEILCVGLDYYYYQTVREFKPFIEDKYKISYKMLNLKILEIK